MALGRGARQAARPAPSPFNAPTKSVRPRHLLRPRAAMCHVKGPSARRPQPRPVPRDQKRGKDSLNAPFDGREAVERGARRAKFAAVFGLRHCGLWEGGKQRGKHHVFLRPLTPPVTPPPPRNVSMPPIHPLEHGDSRCQSRRDAEREGEVKEKTRCAPTSHLGSWGEGGRSYPLPRRPHRSAV